MNRCLLGVIIAGLWGVGGCQRTLLPGEGGVDCGRDEAQPWTGCWREKTPVRLDCGGEPSERTVAEPIAELVLSAKGGFSVTWHPFESFRDYWGTYSVDPAKGTIELTITGGNFVPSDFDGSGRFVVTGGHRLQLSDIWLGSRGDAGAEASPCAQIFNR